MRNQTFQKALAFWKVFVGSLRLLIPRLYSLAKRLA
jgi:hypothetical protein